MLLIFNEIYVFNEILSQHKIFFKMSSHLTCSENFAYSAYFGRNSDKLTTFQTGKPNFSGASNNRLSCSEFKPSILKRVHTRLP